jgi:NAD(P)-dependent dehydrogenase (short-subunit alcohol dehydrogenase family)
VNDLAGRAAFVTGAGQGIGLGIARALAGAGVSVALADIDERALAKAAAEIETLGVRALAVPLDVSDAEAMARAADKVQSTFGKLHILVNNAGVTAPPKPITQLTPQEWDWLVGVNVYGVLHGLRSFLPLIRRHGDGGHVVNTASIGGLQVRPGRGTGGYAATKFAVVAISESLQQELDGSGIGVSVLCPAAVDTAIYESSTRRPARFGGPFVPPGGLPSRAEMLPGALPADVIGQRVLYAIRTNEFFIFTHEGPRAWLEERHRRLMEGFDRAAAYNRQNGIKT